MSCGRTNYIKSFLGFSSAWMFMWLDLFFLSTCIIWVNTAFMYLLHVFTERIICSIWFQFKTKRNSTFFYVSLVYDQLMCKVNGISHIKLNKSIDWCLFGYHKWNFKIRRKQNIFGYFWNAHDALKIPFDIFFYYLLTQSSPVAHTMYIRTIGKWT